MSTLGVLHFASRDEAVRSYAQDDGFVDGGLNANTKPGDQSMQLHRMGARFARSRDSFTVAKVGIERKRDRLSSPLLQPLRHLRQSRLIHRLHRIGRNSLHQRREWLFLHFQPLPRSRREHIPQPDLLRGQLQPCAAVRPLALRDETALVQLQKYPAHHHRAFAQRLSNRRRGVHGVGLQRQQRQHP